MALLVGMVRDELCDLGRFALRSLVFGTLWVLIAVICVAVAPAPGVAVGRRLPVGWPWRSRSLPPCSSSRCAAGWSGLRTGGSTASVSAEEALRRLGGALAETTLLATGPTDLPATRRAPADGAIAEQLHLSASAVEKYVAAILAKLDLPPETPVHRRVAAVPTLLQRTR